MADNAHFSSAKNNMSMLASPFYLPAPIVLCLPSAYRRRPSSILVCDMVTETSSSSATYSIRAVNLVFEVTVLMS